MIIKCFHIILRNIGLVFNTRNEGISIVAPAIAHISRRMPREASHVLLGEGGGIRSKVIS